MLQEVPAFARTLDIGEHRLRCPQCGRGDRDKTLSVTVESRTTGVFNCHRCHFAGNWREVERPRAHIERERGQRAEAAAQRARAIYSAAESANASHPYLLAKGIAPPACARQSGDLLLIPVRSSDGTIVNLQTIAPDGTKRFLPGGTKRACYATVGTPAPGSPIYIAEGMATAATIARATSGACAIAFDAGNLEPVARALRARYPEATLVIAADDDWQTDGNPGIAQADKAARAARALIAIPAGWTGERRPKQTDFNDLSASAGDDAVRAAFAIAAPPGEASPAQAVAEPSENEPPAEEAPKRARGYTDEWMSPFDLWRRDWMPTLDINLMPQTIAEWSRESAELMGADPAMFAMSALAVCAAAASDQHRIQPKRHDPTWTERPRIWVMLIGDPSAKKTPAMTKATNTLHGIEARLRDQYNRELAEYNHACDQARAARRRRGSNDNAGAAGSEPPLPQKPKHKRILVNDATIEKIAHILQDNPHGVLSLQTELASWFGGMDAYRNSNSAISRDRSAWLKLYDGGPHYVDRMREEGSFFVQNFSSCILGGIQPDVIRRAKGADEDGLMQRFIPVFVATASAGVDRPADMAALNRYTEIIDQIFGTHPDPDPIRLSEEAHDIRDEIERRIDLWCGIASGPSVEYHIGKLRGLFVRLLLIYHLIESAERREHPHARRVSGDTAGKVFRLINSFIVPSIFRFYSSSIEADKRITKLAFAILQAGEQTPSRARLSRFMRREWGAMTRRDKEEALDLLVTYGWIRVAANSRNYDGGPSRYEVNPEVFVRFAQEAERERERRRETRRLIDSAVDAAAGRDAPAD